MWTWKDPAVEPPPLRTRIRIRLHDDFRARHKLEVTCVDGYIHERGDLPMYGFSATLGPHVTGWMPIAPRRQPVPEEENDRLNEILDRIGAKVQEQHLKRDGTWYRSRAEAE